MIKELSVNKADGAHLINVLDTINFSKGWLSIHWWIQHKTISFHVENNTILNY